MNLPLSFTCVTELEINFSSDMLSAAECWDTLRSVLIKFGWSEETYNQFGEDISFLKVPSAIGRRSLWLEGKTHTFRYSLAQEHRVGLLFIDFAQEGSQSTWDKWVRAFCCLPPFLVAYVQNSDYAGWQNNNAIEDYDRHG